MKKVMFICSSGGHFTEMKQLEPLFTTYDSVLIREKAQYKANVGIPEHFLPTGTRQKKLQYIFVFMWTCILSLYYFLRFKPDVIVTTGAHTAVPMCYIAGLFHKKIIFIESIARVTSQSLTGKLIAKKCTHILVQWDSMLKLYPKAEYLGQIL